MDDKRIVVGVDGSRESKAALRWAVRQAELIGGGLQLITAWDVPVTFGVPIYADDIDLAGAAREVLEETMTEVLGSKPPVPVEPVVAHGHPARALVEASKGAELLVVGSRGRGGIVGALLGSTSSYCVQHAQCPIVVIRHAEEVT